jgi:sulfur-oxidizing protein SoxY
MPAAAEDIRNPLKAGETWTELRGDVFGDRAIKDAAGVFTIDAPYRAHDAAIVPVTLTQDPDSELTIEKLTLIVDENPAPVVAEFEFGPAMGEMDFETRVRIDLYSNVRAIVEASDGNLYMTGRFVKASGGCSAPALKDMETSISQAGKMKMRFFEPDVTAKTLPQSGERREAQVMLRHPNFSGMQMNQVTQLFIPAFFIDEVEVKQGDDLVFRLEAGISISEDPVFRFKYVRNGADAFSLRATDTDGSVFEKTFPIGDTAS